MFNTILYHENFIIFKPRQTFSFDVVIKYVTVLSGKYLANFTRIPDSAGCLNFAGYWYPDPARPYNLDPLTSKSRYKFQSSLDLSGI